MPMVTPNRQGSPRSSARAQLGRNRSLADVVLAAGFADQAHLSRMFKYAFGVTPGRYRALEANRTP